MDLIKVANSASLQETASEEEDFLDKFAALPERTFSKCMCLKIG